MKDFKEISDVSAFKALSNPLRMRIYYLLQSRGSATAVELAEKLGLDPALVGYHLRKLERFDFVMSRKADLPYRQKLWEPTSRGFTDASDDADGLGGSVGRAIVSNDNAHLGAFLAGLDGESDEWRDAAFITDHLLTLDAEQMSAFRDELMELVERWKSRNAAAEGRGSRSDAAGEGDGERKVLVMAYGFPFIP